MKLALLLALVACSRSEPRPPAIATPGSANVAADAAIASPIPAATTELLVGVVDAWDTTAATLRRYRRAGAAWQPRGAAWPAVVGRGGVAWGIGLHGAGAPADRAAGPTKREGDGKSPAGVFAIRGAYGYAAAAPASAKLPYVALAPAHACVDDPASRHYDRILDSRTVTADWQSHEVMRRGDELYRWVVDVAHNPAHVPGSGSCIFLHVWGGAATATSGCTAMAEDHLVALVATLDPSAVFVLLPRAEYAALASRWRLPPL